MNLFDRRQRPQRRWLRRGGVMLLALAGFAVWLGWDDEPIGMPLTTGAPIPGGGAALALEQGWSAHTLERAWYTSFGSRLLPRSWFLALEHSAGTTLFRDNGHLETLGFLAQAPDAMNPDGLPVGFAISGTAPDDYVGLTCAACHTGEWQYAGKRLRIAGGAGRLDLPAFERSLLRALEVTVDDDAQFARFAARVGGDVTTLRAQLAATAQRLRERARINHVDVDYGPGRLDAFGQIFNTISAEFLGRADNFHAPDAPVSIPSLWNTPRYDRVQWNGSSPNDAVAPLVQNVTTALAVYGDIDLSKRHGLGYRSSADVAALGRLQRWNTRLRSPVWPQPWFGLLDDEAIGRGRNVFVHECSRCHADAPRDEDGPLATVLVPLAEIGTDPRMADNFAASSVDAAMLAGRPALVLGGTTLPKQARAIDLVVHAALGATLQHPLDALRAAWAGHGKAAATTITDTRGYKAAPLAGIWATAPYLHNGSVPTLLDLLRPPAQRPRSFDPGTREFDPAKVGLSADTPADTWRFDTSVPGNDNGGHDYGTRLDAAQKADLLTYLKSL